MGTIQFIVFWVFVASGIGAIIVLPVVIWRMTRQHRLFQLNDELLWCLHAEFVKEGVRPQYASPGKLTKIGYELIIPLGWKAGELGEPGRLFDLTTRIHARCMAFALEKGAKLLFARIQLDDECLMVGLK